MTKHAAATFGADDVAAAAQPAGRRFKSYPPASCRTAAAQAIVDPGGAAGSWLGAVARRAEAAEHDDWMVRVLHPRTERAHYTAGFPYLAPMRLAAPAPVA
jgi:hypothetical protein